MRRAWRKARAGLPKDIRLLLSDTLAQYRLIGVLGAMAASASAWLWVGLLFVGLDWLLMLPAGVRLILRMV